MGPSIRLAAGGRQTCSYFPLRQNCLRILGLLGGPHVLRQRRDVLVVFFNTPRFGERSYHVPYFRVNRIHIHEHGD